MPPDLQQTAQQARSAYDRYLAAFNARDLAVAAGFYRPPVMVLNAQGRRLLQSTAEAQRMLEASLARVDSRGFAASQIAHSTLHVLNERAVLLSAEFQRLSHDGTPLETVACTYVLECDETGWGVVAMIAHPPSGVLPGGGGSGATIEDDTPDLEWDEHVRAQDKGRSGSL